MKHPQPRRPHSATPFRAKASTLAIVAALAGFASAPAFAAEPTATVRQYTIPAGNLGDVLAQYAASAEVQLVVNPAVVDKARTSAGLKGSYSVQAGFAALLAGTGLEAFRQGDGSFRLRAAPVAAAEMVLPAITVTATNFRETLLDDESKPVSVIGREAIQTRTPTSVVEAMKDAPGVGFSRAGGLGGQLVMRGVNSNDLKIPLAINGERFRGRNTLEYNFIDPASVERIEIIRGPAAAIYGSEAMAGMVNIVTRKPRPNFDDEFSFGLSSMGVAYETVNDLVATRLEAEGGGKGFDLRVGVSGRKAGDYETPRGTATNSDFRSGQLDGTVGYSFNPDHRLELNFKLADANSNRAGGLGGAPGMDAPLTSRVNLREDPNREKYLGLAYSGKPDIKGINRIDASLYRRSLYTELVTTRYPNATSVSKTRTYVGGPIMHGGKAMLVSDALQDTILTAGVDFFHEGREGNEAEVDGTGTVKSVPRRKVVSDATQTGVGAFLLAEHELSDRLLLSGNLRYDRYRTETDADVITIPALADIIRENKSAKDRKMTYALGAVFKPLSWLNFAANFGTSYRVPTTVEKFHFSTYGAGYRIPNPALEPEEGKTWDVSARLRFQNLSSNLTVYHSDYSNLIGREDIVHLGLPSSRRVNVGKAEIKGIELDLDYRLTDELSLKLASAYTKGTDKTANVPLAYIAPWVSTLGLRYQAHDYYVEGDVRHSRGKTRIDDKAERATAGYTVLNLYVGMDLNKFNPSLPKATLRFGIENVFDKAYVDPATREVISSPTSLTNPLLEPGRNFKISITRKF